MAKMKQEVKAELAEYKSITLDRAAPLADDRAQWERQPSETSVQFSHFCAYRDLGMYRSLRGAAREVGRNVSVLQVLSQRFRWLERVRAWEAHLASLAQEEHELAVREAKRRHIDIAQEMQRILKESLTSFQPGEMSEQDFSRWFQIAVKVERLSLGLPTEQVNVNYMTWDEAERFAAAVSHLAMALVEYVTEDLREAYQHELQVGIKGLLERSSHAGSEVYDVEPIDDGGSSESD